MPQKGTYKGQYPAPKKYLEYKDKGTEVTKLQNYLNWYTDGKFFKECGPADGNYGPNTLRYTKQMQTDFFGASEADGKVGPKTIAKMKEFGGTPAQSLEDKIIETCKKVANRAKNAEYSFQRNPSWDNINKKGTCVSFGGVVLQLLGYKKKGNYIWHTGKGYGTGKVYGTTSRMTLTYMGNKPLKTLKSKIRKGDFLIFDDNKSGKEGNGGHICIANGTWKGDDCYVWDIGKAMYCEKNGKPRLYDGDHKLLAIVRLKG